MTAPSAYYINQSPAALRTALAGDIGALFAPLLQTKAEAAANVTPVNIGYPADDPRRLGVVGDGVTLDDAAFANVLLVAAQGQQFRGQAGAIYTLSSAQTIGLGGLIFDGQGATFRASGTAGRLITAALAAATATTTVSSGATQGSRIVVVASASNLAIGQWVRIWDGTTQAGGGNWPAYWGKITSIAGTTIGLDRPMPLNFSVISPLNFNAYNTALIGGTIDIKNVTFDGTNVSASPGNDGSAARLLGFEFVKLTNLTIQNFNPATGADIIHGEDCISWLCDALTARNTNCPGSVATVYVSRARKAIYTRCTLEDNTFGLNADWCETALFTSNVCQGRLKFDSDNSVSPSHSVRGLKALGCGFFLMSDNYVADYESPLRGSQVHRFSVCDNVVVNNGLETYAGQICINVSNGAFIEEIFGVVSGNLVENSGGVAIGVDDGNAGATDSGAEVIGNIVNGCAGIGIYLPIGKASAHNNKIINWNQRAAAGDSGAGIYHNGSLNATGNEFKNSVNTYPCFRNAFVSGQLYWLSGNFSPSGNPNFSGGAVDWATRGTANLTAAATSITFNHNCVVTPRSEDVVLSIQNLPTAAIGELCLTAISATQLTVTTRNAPGASTLNIAWAIRINVPHTAP